MKRILLAVFLSFAVAAPLLPSYGCSTIKKYVGAAPVPQTQSQVIASIDASIALAANETVILLQNGVIKNGDATRIKIILDGAAALVDQARSNVLLGKNLEQVSSLLDLASKTVTEALTIVQKWKEIK